MDHHKTPSSSRLTPIRPYCTCVVCKILQRGFSRLDSQEKHYIISSGRPTPFLQLESKIENSTKKFTRYFKMEFYEKNKWLTGCSVLGKLYCWPCLLFSTNEETVWNSFGFSDLNNMYKSVKKHVNTKGHLIGILKEKTIGEARMKLNPDNQINYKLHNELVSNNRNILKRLIDVVCLIGTHELTNRTNYIGLIELVAKYDETLKIHLKDTTAFRSAFATSNEAQDNLMKSIADVVLDSIKLEIKEAKFVSIIMDSSNSNRLAVIVRYIKSDGTVQNRFLKFLDTTATHANTVEIIYKIVEELECGSKFIAQSYDGGVVMTDNLEDVQTKIKSSYRNAIFIHCYAHRLNLILSQSLQYIKDCKHFFSNLNGIGDFLTKSPHITEAVDTQVQKRFPAVVLPINWSDNGRLPQMISQYRDAIINLFQDILNGIDLWDPEIVNSARGYLYLFENDFYFNFLLKVFSDIFPHTDLLSDIIQTKFNDIGFCVQNISALEKRLNQKREQFQHFWDETMNMNTEPQNKRIKVEDLSETELYGLYYQILDTISQQLTSRFNNFKTLKFIELCNFANYDKCDFPEEALTSLKLNYINLFDFDALHSQLVALYASPNELNHKRTPLDMLIFLQETGLDESYAEVLKLCYLVLTVPVTNPSVERNLSVLTRIKAFILNCKGAENFTSLAVLSIEKDCVKNLAQNPKFYEDVTEKFARIEKGLELQYK